ncbi:hypothetical protein GCM10022273_24610 [Cellulomonas soli]
MAADALVCAALARGRRTALGDRLEVRRDGMPDDDVVAAHARLRDRVVELARERPDLLARLDRLDELPEDASWTRWQTLVFAVGAHEDPAVVAGALDVWDALGANAYGLQFRDRPRTYKGFLEGRAWLQAAVLGPVAAVLGAVVAHEDGHGWWWLLVVAGLVWPCAVVVAFRASYRRREKSARAELPHF